jgi:hypothetical protein
MEFSNILKKITFKIKTYHRNFDFIDKYELFISEYQGTISYNRINENKYPLQIGEFYYVIYNNELAKLCNVDIIKNNLLKHKEEESYHDLIHLIKTDKNFKKSLNNYNKIIYINNFILKKEYKKLGITEEFSEFLFKNYHTNDQNTLILWLVKPIQLIKDDFEYFTKEKKIEIKSSIKNKYIEQISANEYYNLSDYNHINDIEMNEYLLFDKAVKCGFKRIDESYIFKYDPDINIIINNIKEKSKEIIDDNFFC